MMLPRRSRGQKQIQDDRQWPTDLVMMDRCSLATEHWESETWTILLAWVPCDEFVSRELCASKPSGVPIPLCRRVGRKRANNRPTRRSYPKTLPHSQLHRHRYHRWGLPLPVAAFSTERCQRHQTIPSKLRQSGPAVNPDLLCPPQ